MLTVSQSLTVVGAITLSVLFARLLNFLWLYFLRPSSIHRYTHGPQPYALVTAATDGIGKAIATELYEEGFNLILHGRSDEKMQKAIHHIKSRVTSRTGDIKYFLADAADKGHDFAKLVEPFNNLHITLVAHVVGGVAGPKATIDEQSEEELLSMFQWNGIFPMFLTRALLPTLRSSAKHGPVLVQFVGTFAVDYGHPGLTPYVASKAIVRSLAQSLDNDERFLPLGNPRPPSGVRFQYLNTNQVSSSVAPFDTGLLTPSAARYAKAVVARAGDVRLFTPYAGHAVEAWVVSLRGYLLGGDAVDTFAARKMENIVAVLTPKRKTQ